MNANATPPPGTRPPVDVASFDRSQLSVYLKDVVTLALEMGRSIVAESSRRRLDASGGVRRHGGVAASNKKHTGRQSSAYR